MSTKSASKLQAPKGDDGAAPTVDDCLAWLTVQYPYRVWLEVYTDADEGWDVYVNHEETAAFHACAPTLLEVLNDICAQVLVAETKADAVRRAEAGSVS